MGCTATEQFILKAKLVRAIQIFQVRNEKENEEMEVVHHHRVVITVMEGSAYRHTKIYFEMCWEHSLAEGDEGIAGEQAELLMRSWKASGCSYTKTLKCAANSTESEMSS